MQSLNPIVRAGLRRAANILSPVGPKGRLLVLIYHRVPEQSDPLLPSEPSAQEFTEHMEIVRSLFNVLPLTEAVARLKDGSIPSRAACITFDDGYINNLDVAAPILRKRNIPATVFVSTGFIDGGCMWNDTLIETVRRAPELLDLSMFDLGVYELKNVEARRAAIDELLGKLKYLELQARLRRVDEIADHVGVQLPKQTMMSESQLRELHGGGIDIGAHTINHPILARLNDEQSRHEILTSKRRLEDIIGSDVTSFAYPNGRPWKDYEARHVNIVRECGFSVAVSTAWGAARTTSNPLQIPRLAPWDRAATTFALRMVKGYFDAKEDLVA